MRKTLLTLDDLFQFFSNNGLARFDAGDAGREIHVAVPALFEVVEGDAGDRRGMMKVKVRVFHTGLNRNNSYVSEGAARAAMPTIKNRPILGAIHQLDNGDWDFESHNVEIIDDGDGGEEVSYVESQIGSFSEEDPFFEHDDATGKDYVVAYGYIPEEYTRACDIIRRKRGTKNSCELSIESLSYNPEGKYLDLESFYVCGSTFLGSRDDGTEVGEGMVGSRADIVGFQENRNGTHGCGGDGAIRSFEGLCKALSCPAVARNTKEGGKRMGMLEKLLGEYGKSAEDVPFDCSSLSDGELEAKFKEAFGGDADSGPDGALGFQKVFEISHEDIRSALYGLLRPYEEADGVAYWITSVYDSYFCYESFDGDKVYGQDYSKDGDEVRLEGERFNLHKELLTDSEYAELQRMREDLEGMGERLAEYEAAEARGKKLDILSREEYSPFADSEEFVALRENMDKYTPEEFGEKAELAFAKCARKFGLYPGASAARKPASRIALPFAPTKKKKSKYSLLFSGGK